MSTTLEVLQGFFVPQYLESGIIPGAEMTVHWLEYAPKREMQGKNGTRVWLNGLLARSLREKAKNRTEYYQS